MHGSGAVFCSCSLLIRGPILPAVRQKLHLSPCADSRSRLCPRSKVNLQQIAESSMLPYYCLTTTRREHGHMPNNLWQPGVSGNPAGRLRGSRNKLSEAVICALLRDFSKHGEKAIAKVRREQPG